MTAALSSDKNVHEPISTDIIRLLITTELDDSIDKTISQFIPCRFVFGVDLKLLRLIKDVLADLRSKLLSEVDLDGVDLEFHLRTTIEYFILPWSTTRDVLHQDDEVILRFRKREERHDENHGSTEVAAEAKQVDDDEIARKKRKREKKRKLEEIAMVKEQNAEIKEISVEKVKKKKKRRISQDRISDSKESARRKKEVSQSTVKNKISERIVSPKAKILDRRVQDSERRAADRKSIIEDQECRKAADVDESRQRASKESPAITQDSRTALSPVDDRSRRKRRKEGKGDVYDNAIVVRHGKTGKIQHVFFDSSEDSVEEPNDDAAAKCKGVSTADISVDNVEPAIITEQSPSKSSAKAMKFSVLINQQTTCEKLEKMLQSGPLLPNGSGPVSVGVTSFIPVVVTRNQLNGNKPKAGKNRYTNVSMVLEKTVTAPIAQSTPIQETPAMANGCNGVVLPATVPKSAPLTESSPQPSVTSRTMNGHSNEVSKVASPPTVPAFVPARPLQEYSSVRHPAALRVGDRIAYKVMELNELDCTPGISDWKIGHLDAFDSEHLELRVKLSSGGKNRSFPDQAGVDNYAVFFSEARRELPLKFRVIDDDEAMENGRVDRMQNKEDIVAWSEIVEARLLNE